MPEAHVVLAESVENEIKIRRSRFIARLIPSNSIEEAKNAIANTASMHPMANHNCWAYIIGEHGEIFHSSDAGEPAGTAGKPMLNALQRHNLTNTAVVVTRYFGGVKLGVRGLIEAYGQAVEDALTLAKLERLVKMHHWRVTVPYDQAETLRHRLAGMGASFGEASYTDRVEMQVLCEESMVPDIVSYLEELAARGILELEEE